MKKINQVAAEDHNGVDTATAGQTLNIVLAKALTLRLSVTLVEHLSPRERQDLEQLVVSAPDSDITATILKHRPDLLEIAVAEAEAVAEELARKNFSPGWPKKLPKKQKYS